MSAGGLYRAFNNVNSMPYDSPNLKYPNLKMGRTMPCARMSTGLTEWVGSLVSLKMVVISWLSMSGPVRVVERRQRSSFGYRSGLEEGVVTDISWGLGEVNLKLVGFLPMQTPTALLALSSQFRNSVWVWSATKTMLLYLHPLYTTSMSGPVKMTS